MQRVQVCRRATKTEVERYGATKLEAAPPFVAEDPKLSLSKVRVPVTRNGKQTKVDLGSASVVEVSAAAKELNAKAGKKPRRNPLRDAVTKALSDANVKGVTVTETRKGALILSGITAE